jgi:hypothetical protein
MLVFNGEAFQILNQRKVTPFVWSLDSRSGVTLLRLRFEVFEVRKSVKRPTGVTIIAVLTFCSAAILAL